jgi:hypothetical protein
VKKVASEKQKCSRGVWTTFQTGQLFKTAKRTGFDNFVDLHVQKLDTGSDKIIQDLFIIGNMCSEINSGVACGRGKT